MKTGCSKNNRENYPGKYFRTKEKETWARTKRWVSSANLPLNNWAQFVPIHKYLLPIKFPFKLIHKLSFYELKISEGLRFEVGNKLVYNFKMQFFSAPAIPVSIQSFKTILYTVPC